MSEVTMTLAASVTLTNIIDYILTDENGNERDLTFDLKYKLLRNKNVLAEDSYRFNEKRVATIRELGVVNEETNTVSVPDEKMEEFKSTMLEFASSTVTRDLVKISMDDVSLLKMPAISSTEMDLFMAVMVDDPVFNEQHPVETETEVHVETEHEE